MTDLREFAAFAERLADVGRRSALHWREQALETRDKRADGAFDPVTRADRETEAAMRAYIERHYPDHGINGEEMGAVAGSSPYGWSLDPIDGTRSFLCNLPSWSILVALLEQEQPVLGVIDIPMLGERLIGWASHCWRQKGEQRAIAKASGCRTLEQARISTTDPYLFSDQERNAFDRVRRAALLTRFGHDGFAYARLATGDIDLVLESGLEPHDRNALIPVVRAAGGAVSNWRGEHDFADGCLVAAASGELLRATVKLLQEA
ncbi:inositol monophosphatase family protein [Allosphingosinicella indica]|uniref:Myo-inositol-1(Or 4)-monophosphatase n=1 Tax=Allosphingosinicella indica TaxID=941907 RepID=A0A1X7FYG9_9SPHN|nr:inositol monophosphatase family protein [Allosphingosinicella indica]SMF61095.1 myo-inositol-1(or 4)-monophosphatase [Allosphingosinicella indica]